MSSTSSPISIAQEIEEGYEQIGHAVIDAAVYGAQSQKTGNQKSGNEVTTLDVPVRLSATVRFDSPAERLPEGKLCCVCVLANSTKVCLGTCCKELTVRQDSLPEYEAAREVESIYTDLGRAAVALCAQEASSSAPSEKAKADRIIDVSMTLKLSTRGTGAGDRPGEGKPLIVCCACYKKADGQVECVGSCC